MRLKKRIGNRGGLSFLLVFAAIVAALPGAACGFAVPERFVYDLTWAGIKAGTATLEISEDKDGYRIVSTAASANWVSVFYTVEDRIEAKLSKDSGFKFIGRSRSYRVKIREGRHRRDKEVTFDHARRKALFADYLESKRKEYDIERDVFDPLSALFFIRLQKFQIGKSLHVDVFDSKKNWDVEVQVLRKERISTKAGEIDTVVIKPLLQSEGIFNRKGDVIIWLTDDDRRIPVKLQSKVPVGSVNATLVEGFY
ncbi:MAG: DUF3108 domain-containing protein [Thermodesulfovibrionales bacterium]